MERDGIATAASLESFIYAWRTARRASSQCSFTSWGGGTELAREGAGEREDLCDTFKMLRSTDHPRSTTLPNRERQFTKTDNLAKLPHVTL